MLLSQIKLMKSDTQKKQEVQVEYVVVKNSIIYNSTSTSYANKQYVKFASEDWENIIIYKDTFHLIR